MILTQDLQLGNCLHIGCGLNTPEEWENIDASPTLIISKIPIVGYLILSGINGPNWSKSAKYGNIVTGLKDKKNSCDLIFASHVLEHLSLADFHIGIENIYKYLKFEGIFRFIVPDLKHYVDTYISQYEDHDLCAMSAEEFMKTSLIGYQVSRKTIFHRLREPLSNSRHLWMWDKPSLIQALHQHGFKSVRQCHYGDWSDPRFAIVESELCYPRAIGIEAIK